MDEPTSLRAGDSIAWTVSLPSYLASAGWTLSYRLINATGFSEDIASTPSGDDHEISLSAADTANYPAGPATLVRIVDTGVQKITLAATLITILPDLSVVTAHDGRSANEKALAAAESALESYLTAGQGHVEEYEIAGRRMKFRAVAEIEALINLYRLRVAKDNAAKAVLAGGAPAGRVYYRG